MTHRASLLLIIALVASAIAPAFGQADRNWVGYQQTNCTLVSDPDHAAMYDANQWLSNEIPMISDSAIFDINVDPQQNGMPKNVHFGPYRAEYTGGAACGDSLFLGNDVVARTFAVQDGEFNFFLEGQNLTTLTLRNSPAAQDPRPNPVMNIIGPGNISTNNIFSSNGKITFTEQTIVANVNISAGFGFERFSQIVIDGPANVTAGQLSAVEWSSVDILGGAQVNVQAPDDAQGIFLFSESESQQSELNISGVGTRVTSDAQIGIASGTVAENYAKATISDGGFLSSAKRDSVSSSSGIVGFQPGIGQMVVEDSGSLWTQDGFLNVGWADGSNGDLEIRNGGRVESTDGRLARFSGSTGVVSVVGTDSIWELSGGLFVGGDENNAGGVGTLSLDAGTVSAGNEIKLWDQGTLRGTGQINANIESLGTISPGEQIGTLNVDGDIGLTAASKIQIEIDGTSLNQIDQILATGDMNLDGDLEISFINGFAPTGTDAFRLFNANAFTGDFANVTISGLPAGVNPLLEIHGNDLYLGTPANMLTGDFDGDGDYDAADIDPLIIEIAAATNRAAFDLTGDGIVDLADRDRWLAEAGAAALASGSAFSVGDVDLSGAIDSTDLGRLLNNFGAATALGWTSGNLDGDNQVGSTDLGLLLNNFGQVAANTMAVPEPSSQSILLCIGIASFAFTRRRNQKQPN